MWLVGESLKKYPDSYTGNSEFLTIVHDVFELIA